MARPPLTTPGVYIQETDAFPTEVVPVATAVPAFVGYTPQASYGGKSLLNIPTKVSSMAEFQANFLLPDPPPPAAPAKQYAPQYYVVPQSVRPDCGDCLNIDGDWYAVLPDPGTIYYLYNCVRLFFLNGGGDCYVVAVGTHGPASGRPLDDPAAQIVNPNVTLQELLAGLALLQNEQEPTLYLCPDATLLSPADNAALMQAMLLQAASKQTAMCIFDLIGARNPDPLNYTSDIDRFRSNTGSLGLNFGTAYYPFVCTNLMDNSDLDYTNLCGGDLNALAALLDTPANPNPQARNLVDQLLNPPAQPLSVLQYQAALRAASSTFVRIIELVQAVANVLPPSGAIAGVYTLSDNTQDVWHSPANVGMVGVVDVTLKLNDDQQRGLNVDAVTGKSINGIRSFPGLGTLIWGARTLDGNSQDWRYVAVRRTMTMLEQSMKLALQSYLFSPNNLETWQSIRASFDSFLTSIWKQGGLQGASSAEAFQVNVGLGATMTAQDLLDNIIRVTVKLAVVHPAEFLLITLEQQCALSDHV